MSIIDLDKLGPAEVAHGFIFWGLTLNVLLLGVMITQVYLYYVTYKKDKIWIKSFVAWLFFADLLNTGFDLAYLYRSLVVKFGDTVFLEKADWMFGCDPGTTAVIAMVVQLFFAWRVFNLTGSWIFTGIISVLAVFGGATGLVTAYQVVHVGYFTQFRLFKTVVVCWLVAAAVDDAIITTILVWYLVSANRKHKTGFERSDLMVDKIIRLTVQTGAITMIFAVLDTIFYVADPSGLHLLFNFPLAKLYSNSVMSGLNSRRAWKLAGSGETDTEGQIATTSNFRNRAISSATGKPTDIINLENLPAEVFVHVESHEVRDTKKSLEENFKMQGMQENWSRV